MLVVFNVEALSTPFPGPGGGSVSGTALLSVIHSNMVLEQTDRGVLTHKIWDFACVNDILTFFVIF